MSISFALEQQLARQWWGLTADEYNELPGNPEWVNPDMGLISKADVVAAYRQHALMEAIQNDVKIKKRR